MKRILILFDGPHLAYSPTPIQFYDWLCRYYEVTIFAQDPANYTGQAVNDRKVVYHRYYGVSGRVFYKVLFSILALFNRNAGYFKQQGLSYRDYFFKFLALKKILKNNSFNRIICIDIINLFYCSLLKRRVDFLSLELTKDQHLLPAIDKKLMNCVIIQSPERYEYLFREVDVRKFFIQNAPVYKELQLDIMKRKFLIYSGSAIEGLGFYDCLNYLNKFTGETLMVQGAFYQKDRDRVNKNYPHLLKEGRLLINNKYLDNDDVVGFISDYQIGFCFYNFDDPFIKDNYFNYFSAPSGKMFKYLAAGVPVVCSNILGFQFVKDFQCGVLIDGLSELEISNAVLAVRANYSSFVENAIAAAKYFSFDKAIQPYIDFIQENMQAK